MHIGIILRNKNYIFFSWTEYRGESFIWKEEIKLITI